MFLSWNTTQQWKRNDLQLLPTQMKFITLMLSRSQTQEYRLHDSLIKVQKQTKLTHDDLAAGAWEACKVLIMFYFLGSEVTFAKNYQAESL